MIKTVKVIPLSSSVQKEYLTYFSAKDLEPGMIVSVPIRKQKVDAMVVEVGEILEDKSAIKQASFNLKKIDSVKGASPFSGAFFRAATEAAKYFAGTAGGVLDVMLPNLVFHNYSKLVLPEPQKPEAKQNNLVPEKLIFQNSHEDRVGFYKTFIRESFARKKSVFICLPTVVEIQAMSEVLGKGIESYTFTFHGEMTNKNFIKDFNACVNESHPVLIIGTGTFLFLPRTDLGAIILEHESSSAYKTLSRPYVDMRVFAELYGEEQKVKLILSDTLLRPETLYRHDSGELGEVAPLSFRIPSDVHQEIINTKVEEEKVGGRRIKKSLRFEMLSEEIKHAISQGQISGEKTFLFALRKGLAPLTVCKDCGTTLRCKNCASSMVLYPGEKEDTYIYVCNTCKREESARVLCKTCGGWNMVPLGIGTDMVVKEVRTLFPDATIIQFDKDIIKTEKEAHKALELFYKTPGAVMCGTELALYYLKEKVGTVGVISFDSLFSIPSFRINEKIIGLVNMLRTLAEKRFILQTKNPEEKILQYLESNNLLNFYRDELQERKMLSYPPFSTLIKVSFRGNEDNVAKEKKHLAELFKEYDPDILDAFIKKVRGLYVTHAILKIPRNSWTLPTLSRSGTFDEKLLALLRALPPSFRVQVDPEDLL